MTFDHLASAQQGPPPPDAAGAPVLDCRAVLASFWDCHDGRSSPELSARVDAHLTACVPCSRLREFQQRFFASLADLRTRSRAPARVQARVRAALAAERCRSGVVRGNSFAARGFYPEAG